MHIGPLNTTGNRAGVHSSEKPDFLFEITLIEVKAVSYNGYIFGSADSYSVYFCTFFFAL